MGILTIFKGQEAKIVSTKNNNRFDKIQKIR